MKKKDQEPRFLSDFLAKTEAKFNQEWDATSEEEKVRLLTAFDTAVIRNVQGQTEMSTQFDQVCFEYMGSVVKKFLKEMRTPAFQAFLLGVGMGALWRHLMEQKKQAERGPKAS